MTRRAHLAVAGAAAILAIGATGCGSDITTPVPVVSTASSPPFAKINYFVVIYLGGHSFDNLYGKYAVSGQWVDGLDSAAGTSIQVDKTGAPYATLPQVVDASGTTPTPIDAFPPDLPNQPFSIEKYAPASLKLPDLLHRYYQHQKQIDGGKMDQFVNAGSSGALPMGYYDTMSLPIATKLATNNVVCDQLYQSAFGGSFLNHHWLVAASTPVFPMAPASILATFDASGKQTADGAVTPDGFAVNTLFSANAPHPSTAPVGELLPSQTAPTIGDRLSDASPAIDWAWYAGGWNDAIAGNPDPSFQFHHQPFAYYERYADGTPGRAAHLKDESDFLADVKAGNLKPVSFVEPLARNGEDPSYTDLVDLENHVIELVGALQAASTWATTAVIITYDENGGFWDHVAPPKFDRWGQGSRVPAIIVSPYAKTGVVDHTRYETASILATLEHRFALAPLSSRDALATDFTNAFDFTRP